MITAIVNKMSQEKEIIINGQKVKAIVPDSWLEEMNKDAKGG